MRERTISISELLKVLKNNVIWFLLISIIFGSIGFLTSEYLVVPVYEAQTKIEITEGQNSIISEISELSPEEMIKQKEILNRVNRNLNLNISVDKFQEIAFINSSISTEIYELYIRDENPNMAMNIANEAAISFREFNSTTIDTYDVKILEMAELPSAPVAPRTSRVVLFSVLLGFMISAFAFILVKMYKI